MIKALNIRLFCTGNSQSVYGVVTLIKTFCPVFYPLFLVGLIPMINSDDFCLSGRFISLEIQVMQDIIITPLVPYEICHTSARCPHIPAHQLKHFYSFFCNVLRLAKLSVNEIFGDVFCGCHQALPFGLGYFFFLKSFFNPSGVVVEFVGPLLLHVIKCCTIAFLCIAFPTCTYFV